ncbi:uncharacterized protein LOC107046727 [Diachasma alloeum]|uniref:uncharacterized protein LOC107046727 n=1 Tax=Diachasma alloeum TaxID=454923 RepID=UPI0007382C4A|nr:uncharacterized protein LOC107046727 [Diachasma alloeum]
MASTSGSSSEDDEYDYCNAAARLKALKSQKKDPPRAPPPRGKPGETPVIETPNGNDIVVKETVKNGSVKSVTSVGQCSDSDDVETISDSASSHMDEGVIDLSSVDAEPPRTLETPIEILDSPPRQALNESNLEGLDDTIIDDPMVDVHVRWKSNKIESIQLDKHESLMKIFQKFADQENIPVNRIIVTRKDMLIKPSDTPASLKLSIIDILEGGVISAESSKHQENQDEDDDEDMCKIKAQVSAKKSVMYKLRKDEPFSKLREHCSKELEVPVEKIKFYFDGDQVEDPDTPDILDLDDEACIDIKILT